MKGGDSENPCWERQPQHKEHHPKVSTGGWRWRREGGGRGVGRAGLKLRCARRSTNVAYGLRQPDDVATVSMATRLRSY